MPLGGIFISGIGRCRELLAKQSHVGGLRSGAPMIPKDAMGPNDLLNFIELDWFVESWDEMGLSDGDLYALQIMLMADPRAGSVMRGSGGLRKLRYSPERWNTGRSGAVRVCYAYFEKYGIVLLCLAFRKGDMDNLSDAGKSAAKKAIGRIDKALKKRFGF
jgi:hypothetical protein